MNRITQIFNIQYPVVQGGMVWTSGWKLAAAVSNAGGLGLIGAGSMYPDVFREHIQKCKKATQKPFGVNVPLLYPQTEDLISIIEEEGVKVVFTSAGSPRKYTRHFQSLGIKVAHVIANLKFAGKCADAGVDAIVAEGFEAGGHNGAEETTTMALIPYLSRHIDTPLIAAGGIATGDAMFAAMAMGADGVQVGSRFAASLESSCHQEFKQKILDAKEGDTKLMLKKVGATRLLHNDFASKLAEMENRGAAAEEIAAFLGRGRAKKGMFEGNISDGELEIGQVSALINDILPVDIIMKNLISEFNGAQERMKQFSF